MAYNAYEATNPRLSKNKPLNEGASAGGAKTPRVAVNKSDLEAQAAAHGWQPRSFKSIREIREMSSAEYRYHEIYNAENLRDVFEREAVKEHNKQVHPVWEARRMWAGKATPDENARARAAGDAFAVRFPQFERSLANAQTMISYMEQHDLDATRVESYVTAFRALREQGKLTLAKAQSADEFYETHAELHDSRVPPLIAARHAREENTEAHFAKSASATSEGSVTRIVDYKRQKHGVPPESDKYSFKMKVRSMSADELAQRCAGDPAFKAALDALD